jgi:hypothetical protein
LRQIERFPVAANPEAAFGSVFIGENVLVIREKRGFFSGMANKATPDRESLQSLMARLKPRP